MGRANGSRSLPIEWEPFVRSDDYGELGTNLWHSGWKKNTRLAILALTVLPLKTLGALWCLLSFYVAVRASFLIPTRYRSDIVATLGKIHCRACLFCLGFIHINWVTVDASPTITNSNKSTPPSSSSTTTTTTTPLLQQQQQQQQPSAAGIVSNHCGWVDIIIVMARYFPAFTARSQTKYLPLVGPISRAMSCLYVERATQGQGVASLVRDRMQATYNGDMPGARPMFLFPEGTTTNGNYLLPFRTGAFIAGVPLQPIVLQYHHSGRVSPCWESMSAAKHIFLMLCEPFHSVTLYQLPVYVPNEGEMADAKVYATNVRQVMRQFAGLKDTFATFLDKLRYHSYLREKHGIVDKKKERLLVEMEQQEESSSKER